MVKPKSRVSTLQGTQIEPPIYKTRIKIIGIGGGGSSIVSEIAQGIKKANFVVVNTDQQALKQANPKVRRFQFGRKLTQGLGTGMNPELGEMCALEDKEKIKELLKETDFCILVSCLGGGTGSGATPVFAEVSKKLGNLTFGIFTLPFEFEGGKRMEIAKTSLEKLKLNLNASVIIPNQRIFHLIDKDTPLKEALSAVNENLAGNLAGLIEMISSTGLINVDFADLKTILAGRGRLAYLNSAEAKSPDQVDELTKKVLANPLSPYSVQGAKEILFNIDGGLNLNMSQVEQIGKTISSSINPQARVAFGITPSKKEGVKITLLANGCKWEDWVVAKEKSKKGKPKKAQAVHRAFPQEEPVEEALISKAQEETGELTSKEPKKIKKTKKPPQVLVSTPPPPIEKPELEEGIVSSSILSPARRKRIPVKIEVRRSALELKDVIQEEEKKLLAQERKWETPAFLRKRSEG